jgi:hypothetical protein
METFDCAAQQKQAKIRHAAIAVIEIIDSFD